MTKVFPAIKPVEECVIKPTVMRIRHDEEKICKKLIARHGKEDFLAMAKDIKLNYLQWSKGQCKKYVEGYLKRTGELDTQYKQAKF